MKSALSERKAMCEFKTCKILISIIVIGILNGCGQEKEERVSWYRLETCNQYSRVAAIIDQAYVSGKTPKEAVQMVEENIANYQGDYEHKWKTSDIWLNLFIPAIYGLDYSINWSEATEKNQTRKPKSVEEIIHSLSGCDGYSPSGWTVELLEKDVDAIAEIRRDYTKKKIQEMRGVRELEEANSNTLTCGLKTVTVSGKKIIKIVHEDGSVHTGTSITNNWTYDGKSITHRIMKEPLPCGSLAKSREEVIAELSARFTKNPKSFGMTAQEAKLIGNYTAKLMRHYNSCHLLVDAAKSTSRTEMFFIDCNDKQANTKRYWVSRSELDAGAVK